MPFPRSRKVESQFLESARCRFESDWEYGSVAPQLVRLTIASCIRSLTTWGASTRSTMQAHRSQAVVVLAPGQRLHAARLENLRQFPALSHAEVMTLVDERRLRGQGLSAVDAHLLGAVLLTGGSRLWTRDKRLVSVCREVGVAYVDAS